LFVDTESTFRSHAVPVAAGAMCRLRFRLV